MSSPLFDAMGSAPQSPMAQMMREFEQFKASFQGDARQEVQNLLNSGRMTQDQYNQLTQTAQQMAWMMGR